MGSGWRVLSQLYVAVKGLFRHKGAVFWIIVFPILFYTLMVAIWGSPSYHPVPLGVVDEDAGDGYYNFSQILLDAMNESHLFKINYYNSTEEMVNAIRRGRVSVGILIPGDFSENITRMEPATLHLYYTRSPWSSYDTGVVSGFISRFSESLRSRALNISLQYALQYVPENMSSYVREWYGFVEKPVRIVNTSYTPEMLATKEGIRAFYAIGMIGVEILFIGLSAGVFAIIDMKREGTLSLLLSSPIRSWEAFISLTLEVLYGVAISALAILLFSLPLGASYHLTMGQALALITLLLVGTLFTIGLGLILAPLARSQEAAMAIVNGLAFPIMFIGGLVIPDFVLPSYLRSFAKYYPLSMSIKAIRDMTIYNATPREALVEAWPAVLATIIVYLLGFMLFNKLIAQAAEE